MLTKKNESIIKSITQIITKISLIRKLKNFRLRYFKISLNHKWLYYFSWIINVKYEVKIGKANIS